MVALPRIITVDPTWTLARVVRSAIDLLDRSIIQVDVPGGGEALEEIKRGGASLVISAWELYDDVNGPELAMRVKQAAPDVAVVILADMEGPDLDSETLSESPFIYMRRPVDIHQFLRVLIAGLENQNVFEASKPVMGAAAVSPIMDRGPVPAIDMNNARTIVKRMLVDVGAMAIVLSTRVGEVLLEDGAPGYVNREDLTNALLPSITTNIDMTPLIGGQTQTIQFFDGEEKDVFVFSVGLHHFLCAIFDGQAGGRQFGVVNRYGRQAVADLVAMMGPSAYTIQKASPVSTEDKASRKRKTAVSEAEEEKLEPVIVRQEIALPEPERLVLDPIQNLDFGIFDQLGNMDSSAADDLFDPDKMAEMATKGSGRKELTFDEAINIGLLADVEAGSKAKK